MHMRLPRCSNQTTAEVLVLVLLGEVVVQLLPRSFLLRAVAVWQQPSSCFNQSMLLSPVQPVLVLKVLVFLVLKLMVMKLLRVVHGEWQHSQPG